MLKISNKIKYSCEEHVDIALDEFLDEFETFPYLTYVNDYQNSKVVHQKNIKCSYCNSSAVYSLDIEP